MVANEVFGFWTVSREKKALLRRHFGLWDEHFNQFSYMFILLQTAALIWIISDKN